MVKEGWQRPNSDDWPAFYETKIRCMLATLYCISAKLSEHSLHSTFLEYWRWDRCIVNFATSAVLTTGRRGLERKKTAEYMMFQHVSNIFPSSAFHNFKKISILNFAFRNCCILPLLRPLNLRNTFVASLSQCYVGFHGFYQSTCSLTVNGITHIIVFSFVTSCRIFGWRRYFRGRWIYFQVDVKVTLEK